MKFSFSTSKPTHKPTLSLDHKPDKNVSVDVADANTVFHEHYQSAMEHAEKSNFSESLRSFDTAIRFWSVHLEELAALHLLEYKQLKFVEINTCDASNYFLNLKKQNNAKRRNKKLWKPPPLNQTQENDKDEETDSDDDIDLIQNEHKMDVELEKWKECVTNHRKSGSEMYEYYAQVLLEMDRDFAAIKACQSAILLNDFNAINWLTLSRAELNFGDPFQALLSISRAIELDYENDEIVHQYSNVYVICNKLNEMKEFGKMSDSVLRRRMQRHAANDDANEVKSIKHRLTSLQQIQNEHINLKHSKTDVQQIVENYQKSHKANID